MRDLINIADRILGRPLLALPEKVETLLDVLGPRIGMPLRLDVIEHMDLLEQADTLPTAGYYASRFAGQRADHGKYRVTSDGIAIIPILGTLVNRGAWIGAQSGLTSYEGIAEQLRTVERDSAVRAVVLDMDTPGGEAAGAFEIPGMIRAIRAKKPVVAMVNDMAASAGYAIASAASKIYVTQTGLVGSIGVVLVHFDRSKQLEMAGIVPTIIHAGSKKADGNPYGPLPAAVRERLKAEVEGLRELFIDTVAEGRPGLKKSDIKATEAGCFMGESAVKIGLADGIATFDQVLSILRNGSPASVAAPLQATTQETTPMAETTTAAAPAQPDTAALEAAAARGRAEGDKAGRQAERARIKGIISAPEAAGRADLANHLAFDTDMAAESAVKALAAAPKADTKPTAGGSAFYEAMANNGGNPQVRGNGNPDTGGAQPVSSFVADSMALFKRAS
jgi:signal peptide peptidase SppA